MRPYRYTYPQEALDTHQKQTKTGLPPVFSASALEALQGASPRCMPETRVCMYAGSAPRKNDVSRFSEEITLSVTLPRAIAAENGYLRILCDDTEEVRFYPLSHRDTAAPADTDTFRVTLSGEDLCAENEASGLFFYRFEFDTPRGHLICGKDPRGFSPRLSYRDENIHAFQWTVIRDGYFPPATVTGGVMYHIFVDRFAPGTPPAPIPRRPDAIYNEDWYKGIPQHARVPGGEVKNNEFFGGTLWGIAEKLPYLQSLGVTLLYLSPIFKAYSNHKYDTGDYETVDEGFGGDAALSHLIRRAEDYGIRIICDGVFNHTGDNSRYFNRYGTYEGPGAYNSKASPYYPWYRFRTYPDDYDCWWGVRILPALYSGNPDFRAYICGEEGIIRKWMKMGVFGWRLDVADELDDRFLCDLRKAVKEERPDGPIWGEVWEDASNKIAYDHRRRYFRGEQLDSVMNYPFRDGIIAFVRDGDAQALSRCVETLCRHYPDGALHMLMNLIGTHDTERILTVLGGIPAGDLDNDALAHLRMTETERARGLRLVSLAAILQFTLPGIPCIYYGDEAGMEGYRDPFNRRPYPWGREEETLLALYRRLGAIRRENRLLGHADTEILSDEDGIFCFARTEGRQRILVCVNRGQVPYAIRKPCKELITGKPYTDGISVAPDTGVILQML